MKQFKCTVDAFTLHRCWNRVLRDLWTDGRTLVNCRLRPATSSQAMAVEQAICLVAGGESTTTTIARLTVAWMKWIKMTPKPKSNSKSQRAANNKRFQTAYGTNEVSGFLEVRQRNPHTNAHTYITTNSLKTKSQHFEIHLANLPIEHSIGEKCLTWE